MNNDNHKKNLIVFVIHSSKKLKYPGQLNLLWLIHRIINKITRGKSKYYSGQYLTKGFDSL